MGITSDLDWLKVICFCVFLAFQRFFSAIRGIYWGDFGSGLSNKSKFNGTIVGLESDYGLIVAIHGKYRVFFKSPPPSPILNTPQKTLCQG